MSPLLVTTGGENEAYSAYCAAVVYVHLRSHSVKKVFIGDLECLLNLLLSFPTLFSYRKDQKPPIVLLDKLAFPNGLAPSPDRDALLMVETNRRSIRKVFVSGSRRGKMHFSLLLFFLFSSRFSGERIPCCVCSSDIHLEERKKERLKNVQTIRLLQHDC